MKTIEYKILNTKQKLRFVPFKLIRQGAILKLLRQEVRADFAGLMLNDDLGRFTGGMLYPFDKTVRKLMGELGSTFYSLSICNEVFIKYWNHISNKSFNLQNNVYHNSLIYNYVYKHFGHFHVSLYGYPLRNDGSQAVVTLSRYETKQAFGRREHRIIDKICNSFSSDLAAVKKGGPFLPRLAGPAEHTINLDQYFRPLTMAANVNALLAFFYGPLQGDSLNPTYLPSELIFKLREERDRLLGSGKPAQDGFSFVITKARRGRGLCLAFSSNANGVTKLTIHEDESKLRQLRGIIAACRAFSSRARLDPAVFPTCLILKDEIQNRAEQVALAGLAGYTEKSANKILTKARQVIKASESSVVLNR